MAGPAAPDFRPDGDRQNNSDTRGRFGLAQEPTETASLRHQGEDSYRLILDSVRDYAIFTADPQGRTQTWAPGAEAVYGWRAA